MTAKPDPIIMKAIAANIEALGQLVDAAALQISQANMAISQGEQNQAIGSIVDLDQTLQDALALQRAALALHKNRWRS